MFNFLSKYNRIIAVMCSKNIKRDEIPPKDDYSVVYPI